MMESIRDAYGDTLVELGKVNKNIVTLDADLSCSTKTKKFADVFPDRFFNVGIAEQNMVGVATGLSTCGKIPFCSTFAMFATGRCYDQIRNGICYSKSNVKIVSTHGGISVGPDGVTHQALEDISLMRGIPDMVVIVPADATETKEVIRFASEYKGPMYVRLSRIKYPKLFDENYKFEFGKGKILREGKDICLIGTGIMVSKCLEAAEKLKEEGIEARVINISTIKPIDKEMIIQAAEDIGKVITVEEHNIIGGLGSAVSEVLSENYPIKMKRIGVNDTFAESGDANELFDKYGLNVENIVKNVKKLI